MSKILLKGMRIVNDIYRCNYCNDVIEDGDIYLSKRRSSYTIYYCIVCAEILNMVTVDEIKESIELYEDVEIKERILTYEGDAEQLEFTLTPVEKKEIKKIVKSRADIKNDLGIRKRYRHKRFRLR